MIENSSKKKGVKVSVYLADDKFTQVVSRASELGLNRSAMCAFLIGLGLRAFGENNTGNAAKFDKNDCGVEDRCTK